VKPFPLQTLLELSQLRMDDAAKRLGELLAGEQEAGARVILLQQYRAEYNERFVVAARNGIGRDAWSNYQSFLARLDDAITQAQAMVVQSKQRTADGQREWVAKHGRVKAFDTLSQRHHSREQGFENRKEQKAQDEHAARYYQERDEEE
jgi:flagellar FliJ protein